MSESSQIQPARAQQGAFSVLTQACSAISLPHCTNTFIQFVLAVVAFIAATACNRAAEAPPVMPYTPKYAYQSAAPAPQRQDVAIAIVNPILKGMVAGGDGVDMLKALPSALTDLITAKGMTYRGPFEQLDTMTFPDKKGSDLALFAEIELEALWEVSNYRAENRGFINGSTVGVCDVKLSSRGRVSFVVIEPLSKETLWRKTVTVDPQEVAVPNQTGDICRMQIQRGQPPAQGVPLTAQALSGNTGPKLDGELGNTYRKMLEATFNSVMKGIDTYVNTEEFVALKHQSQELREKKVY
jgi:hypothetical protein